MSFPTRSNAGYASTRTRRNNSSASSSSSTSSSDYEHENLFHKLDPLKRSPLAGLYNVVCHRGPPSPSPSPQPPIVSVTKPPSPEPEGVTYRVIFSGSLIDGLVFLFYFQHI